MGGRADDILSHLEDAAVTRTDIAQDLKNWNVSNVTNMEKMFYDAKYFNQDLSIWDVDNVENCSNFFDGATKWDLPKPNFINCDPN